MRRPRATALTSAFAVLASTLTFTGAAMVTTTTTASADVIQGAWTQVGTTPFNSTVFTLAQEATGTGVLYAGGNFLDAGGVAEADYIAKIDPDAAGTDWTALAPGMEVLGYGNTTQADNVVGTSAYVFAIAPDATTSTVFLGGNFSAASTTKRNIVSWDGTSTSFTSLGASAPVVVDINEGVEEIVAVDGDTFYMAGTFANAFGNISADNLALYDATTAYAAPLKLGGGTVGTVNAIARGADATVTALGSRTFSPYVQQWNCDAPNTHCTTSSSMTSVNLDASTAYGLNDNVYALAYQPTTNALVAGGVFTKSSASPQVNMNGLAIWDDTNNEWLNIPSASSGVLKANGSVGTVEIISFDGSNTMYIGGDFASVNGVAANNIAKYDFTTQTWSSLGCGALNGVNGSVRAILPQTAGPSVIVSGAFTNAGGNSAADYVARYTPGADNCPSGSSDTPDPAPPAPSVTIDFDGNGGVCTPSSITADQGTWGKALTVDQCTYGSKTLSFFSTSPTVAAGATNVAPGGNIYFSEPARFYAIWSSERPSPVTDVVATPALNAVKVTWKPPVSDGGASLRDYCVVLRTQTNTVISAVCSRPDQPLEATVNLPATNSKYTFTVVARNSVGTSEPVAATPVSPYAIKNVVASRPDVLLGLGGTKVEASGDAPGLAGQSLNVQYKVGSAKWTTEANAVKVNAKSKFSWSKKIARASNNKNVTVRFTYGSDAVAGPYVLARGGEAGDLSAPRNIKVNNSVNEVYVTWDPPKFDGGSNITGYVLCAIPSRGAKTCKDPSYTKAILWNLNTMETYTITVAAKNAAGEGPEGKYAKTVDPTEASIRGVARSFDELTADVRGAGFKKNSKFRVEIAIPVPGEDVRTWNWEEVKSFKDDQPFFFRKTLQIPLDSRYSGERVLLRLVTPTGTVYSRSIRP